MIYDECIKINLLEDYRFTYEELKEVLWENPEELCFKLFYKLTKYKPKEEQISYSMFEKYFRIVESQTKEVHKINDALGSLIEANIQIHSNPL